MGNGTCMDWFSAACRSMKPGLVLIKRPKQQHERANRCDPPRNGNWMLVDSVALDVGMAMAVSWSEAPA